MAIAMVLIVTSEKGIQFNHLEPNYFHKLNFMKRVHLSCLMLLTVGITQAQILLKPDRVFDGSEMQDWVVLLQVNQIHPGNSEVEQAVSI